MNYDIILDGKDFGSYFLEENGELKPFTYLPNTNRINIIVGTNNSGKSRFMRSLMCKKEITGVKKFKNIINSIDDYNLAVRVLNRAIDEKVRFYENEIVHELDYSTNQYYQKTIVEIQQYILNELKFSDYLNWFTDHQNNLNNLSNLIYFQIGSGVLQGYSLIDSDTVKEFESTISYYIPTLRTAHSLFQKVENEFSKIEDDIFSDTITFNYGFINENEENEELVSLDFKNDNLEKRVTVFTGLHLYKSILNARNSKRSVRKSFEEFEKFIGEYFFGGKQVDIVAEFNKDHQMSGKNSSEVISIHIEGEKDSRQLSDLGDGIQAIIVLMYPIFTAEENAFIFIDEPELNLHPGMQRLFLEQISSNEFLEKKKLIYFIATHSNHLLDLTLEKENISIYSFTGNSSEEEDNKFTIRNVNAGDNSVLKNLGVNNSSVFLANCSIWVEGISDRNYLKAFLKSYVASLKSSPLKEDIDFAFFEYAGSNIDHYFFGDNKEETEFENPISDIKSLALNNKIFLLADSDNASQGSAKRTRLEALENEGKKNKNFHPYIIWDIREIENLLTNEIWKEILMSLCNKELVEDYKDDVEQKINSALSEINTANFQKDYIGVFLNELRNKIGKIGNRYILNDSSYKKNDDTYGTLSKKRELSEELLSKDIKWEVFAKSEEIKTLTETLYEFIIDSKS